MFFSWSSAMREIKRIREAGGKANISKRWYGWIVVDAEPRSKSIPRLITLKHDINPSTNPVKNIHMLTLLVCGLCR